MKRRNVLTMGGLAAVARMFGAAGAKLPDAVIDAKNAKVTNESFGELRVFFEGPTDQLKSMTAGSLKLKPGMSPHPPHEHPEEEFMVVTEGTGEILVGGKTVKVGPGSMMYCAANKSHGVKNTGTAPLLFYYYKWQA
jgi:mannose-6-phosphate isomerase-like protein (cupin superfamily)